jgi:hypothetical protein
VHGPQPFAAAGEQRTVDVEEQEPGGTGSGAGPVPGRRGLEPGGARLRNACRTNPRGGIVLELGLLVAVVLLGLVVLKAGLALIGWILHGVAGLLLLPLHVLGAVLGLVVGVLGGALGLVGGLLALPVIVLGVGLGVLGLVAGLALLPLLPVVLLVLGVVALVRLVRPHGSRVR